MRRVTFAWEPESEFVPRSRCEVATAIVGSAVVGAGASIFGASKAADAQTQAAQASIAAQQRMFDVTQANLQPYNQAGISSMNALQAALPGLTAPFNPTMAQLQATPGYQFTLDQGLKSTQNAYAAQGLGTSGAALKGAANYASGLASTTYQQQLQNYLTQNAQAYNMLYGPAALGENAAAGVGNAATATGQGMAQSLTNAGTAQAGAYLATGQAIGNAAASMPMAFMYNQLYGGANTNSGGPWSYGGGLAGGGV